MDKWKKTIMHMGAYPAALGKWVLLGGIIGVAGGVIGSLFHIGVNYATAIRGAHPWILYLLPVGGLAIVGLYKLCHLEGKGTNAIIESVHFGESVPILLVPVIFVSTVITHLCGGSAGREGAALQIGGGLGYEAGKLLHLGEKDLPLATLCGMSGVFSALFGTPLTATVFALEVISVGVLYYAGLVPCITAAMAAFGVFTLMGVEPTRFAVAMPPVTLETMVPVVALAILCAVVSILFCKGLHWTERLLDRGFRSPWVRVLAGSVLLIGMSLLTNGDYNGAGMDVIARALAGNPSVILADEPTGALDSHTGREVLGLLQQLHKQGHTVVLITHDNSIAVQADRIIRLEDGRVVYDGDSHAPEAMVQPTLLPETPEKEEQA